MNCVTPSRSLWDTIQTEILPSLARAADAGFAGSLAHFARSARLKPNPLGRHLTKSRSAEIPWFCEAHGSTSATIEGVSDSPITDLLFEVQTPLGFQVRATRSYWETIICIKHPVMAGRELEVKATLEKPEEIRQSRIDSEVYLFYRSEQEKRWVCAVTKRLNEEGFLITAYPTDAIKEGTIVWPK